MKAAAKHARNNARIWSSAVSFWNFASRAFGSGRMRRSLSASSRPRSVAALSAPRDPRRRLGDRTSLKRAPKANSVLNVRPDATADNDLGYHADSLRFRQVNHQEGQARSLRDSADAAAARPDPLPAIPPAELKFSFLRLRPAASLSGLMRNEPDDPSHEVGGQRLPGKPPTIEKRTRKHRNQDGRIRVLRKFAPLNSPLDYL